MQLYVFVNDSNVTIVAHAESPDLIGISMKGMVDVSGKPFRDEIVGRAQNERTAWVEYIYTSPAERGLYYKSTYCRLVRGSDGRGYVVCSGKYEEGP